MMGAVSARRRHNFRDYLNAHVLVMLALGFSSGLPFLLVGNTFGFWLADEGTSLTAIGFMSWVGIAYSLKFVWAPLLDRLDVSGALKLGHRRGWMILSQLVTGLGLLAMAAFGLSHGLVFLGALSLVVLVVAMIGYYGARLSGGWRGRYVIAAAVALYFNFFVLIVQSFEKISVLHDIAPTQTSPVFGAAQLVTLILFVVLTVVAFRRFHPVSSAVVQPVSKPPVSKPAS